MSPANINSLASFAIWIPFITFCSLTSMASTSNTILNKSGERGHPCLVHDLSPLIFHHVQFSPLSILAVDLSYMVFIMLRNFPYISTPLWVFFLSYHCIKCFFWIYWEGHMIFTLHFVSVAYDFHPPFY